METANEIALEKKTATNEVALQKKLPVKPY